ncbi:uncharacterized protein LOC122139930 [Cyprinus carpio]|uniref:Uncharacterized protein LOC122139930 n=1 Tax=Cyprinus carpio TaxID=7962 RepID=A0A9Q9X6N4_CYPCA|nr:uncharacterized protein LOC122139930 [Cyprinus carpio]
MSLTVSRGESLTVITVTSNPKSKWPVLCQILGFLCCSPVSPASYEMKGKLMHVHTALGYLIVGILCVLHAKFPSTCLLVITVILNLVSATLAIAAVVLYSIDLNSIATLYCNSYSYSQTGYSDLPFTTKEQNTKMCLDSMIRQGLNIIMIALLVLQLCMTIIFYVLTGKVCKKDEDVKVVYHQHYYNNHSVKSTVIMREFQRAALCVHDCLWFCSRWKIQNFTSRCMKMPLLVLHEKKKKKSIMQIMPQEPATDYRSSSYFPPIHCVHAFSSFIFTTHP